MEDAILALLMLVMLAIPPAMTIKVQQRLRTGVCRPVDLGVAFIWVVFLYAFLPVAGIVLAANGLGELPDQRLQGVLPEPDAVVAVAASYTAFMLAFALAYMSLRTWPALQPSGLRPSTNGDLRLALGVVILIKGSLALLTPMFGAGPASDYISTYLTFRGQPLLVQQVAGVLVSLDFAATVLLVVTAVAHSRKARLAAGALVVAQIAFAVLMAGSRSYAFLCAFAFIVAKSIYEPRLRFSRLALYGVMGVAAFLVAGLLRGGLDEGESVVGLRLLQDGEFMSVFINSLDLRDRLTDSDLTALHPSIYFVDILRIIPQQIVGSIKVDPASYYVNTFHPGYGDAGGGLAFGSVAEATIGFGWPEAFFRGGLLGCLYAFLANRCFGKTLTVLRVFVYVWFVVISYQAVRDTTFSVVPRFLMHVVPLLLLVKMIRMFRWATPGTDASPRPSQLSGLRN